MDKTHNRQTGGSCRAWHPDSTTFSDADYREAGMHVPTPEESSLWAEIDEMLKPIRAEQGSL